MRDYRKSANPFYGLLVITGIVFVITATAYGVMALTEVHAAQQAQGNNPPRHPLIAWMSRHGDTALLAELGFLAAFTFGAIGTDEFWQRRAAAARRQRHTNSPQPMQPASYTSDQFQRLVEEDERTRPTHDTIPPDRISFN